MNFLNPDGSLRIVDWAERDGAGIEGALTDCLVVESGHLREHPMYGSTATGDALVSNGFLGVDLIRVPSGGGFSPHTHPGDHLLIVVSGEGTVTYNGTIYPTHAGQVYMVEGSVPHAVGAITDHLILAVGAPHRPVDAADRMTLVDYRAVTADMGNELHCLICDVKGNAVGLRQVGCTHAPTEPAGGKMLVVGVAPADKAQLDDGRRPWEGTASGARLCKLLNVGPGRLFDVIDGANLFPTFLGDWQSIPRQQWADAGLAMQSAIGGRVVVAAGKGVARALGVEDPRFGGVECVFAEGKPALVLTIPHPSGLSRTWNDPEVRERCTAALAVARTLASAGSPRGSWQHRDAQALEAITAAAFMAAEA